MNTILKQLKTKKINIISENEKQMSIITNIKQKLEKRQNNMLKSLNINKDPLLRIEIFGHIEEYDDIINKLNEMVEHLIKINKYCKEKGLRGGVMYNRVLGGNYDINMMPHLASYYEGGNIVDGIKKGWKWIKDNPIKASTYALGAIGLANILTNPPELDVF